MPNAFPDVDAYLRSVAEDRRASLIRLREMIRQAVPETTESIQHNMPWYEHHGMLCAFAAQKQYLSFYLLNGQVADSHRELLEGLNVGKGCIRFRHIDDLPEATVRQLLAAAVAANEAGLRGGC